MLKRVSRGLGHTAKQAQKIHLKVDVEKLDNLPAAVKKCRVVWSRGPKVQMTNIKDVTKGAVNFKQQLSQIATMYRDAKGGFEPKDYKFQVQVPAKGDETKLITVGKADLDLSVFAVVLGQPQSKLVPIMFKVGAASTGYLKLLITAEAVAGDVDEDGMTEVSGMTGVAHMIEEQDLSGFNEEAEDADKFSLKASLKPSPAAAGSAGRKNSRFAAGATTAAAAADEAKSWEAKSPGPGSRRGSDASSKALAAAAAATDGDADDNGDISPMSLSPSVSSELPAEAAKLSSRSPGMPSVVGGKGTQSAAGCSSSAAAAAKDARSQLWGGEGSLATASRGPPSHMNNGKSIPELSEDEARSELFGGGSSSRSKVASAAGTAAKQGSKAPGSSGGGKIASSSSLAPAEAAAAKPPVGKAAAPIPRTSSASSSNVGTSVGSGAASYPGAAGAGGRRVLCDRSPAKGLQEQPAAEVPSSSMAASSSNAEPVRASSLNKHSLSDTDDEDKPLTAGYSGQVLKVPASRQASTAVQPPQQLQHSTRQSSAVAGSSAGGSSDSAASRQLAADNEKLRAQLVALREQAAAAEDARRQARLAAENAAEERDEYKEQAEELQQQLKEAIVGMVTAEEADDLQRQVQQLHEQLHLQRQHVADSNESEQWQRQEAQLKQQLTDAQQRAEDLQQLLNKHQQLTAEQAQQLHQQTDKKDSQHQEQQHRWMLKVADMEQQLAKAAASTQAAQLQKDDLANQVAELTREVVATQELLQLQQEEAAVQTAEAAKPHSSSGDVPALSGLIVDLRAAVAAAQHNAAGAVKQRDAILKVLLEEVQAGGQQGDLQQYMADSTLAEAAKLSTACLGEDQSVQEALVQILVVFKAALADAAQHKATETRLADTFSVMKGTLHEVQAARKAEREQQQQQQQQQQPAMDVLVQQMAQLEAQVSHLQQDKQHLLQQQQQQQLQKGGSVQGQEDLIELRQQLASSRRKVQQLTQARDKLEVILHDFDAAAAEEKQQLETQLSAAHQAAREATTQLTDVAQQLAQAQQQLAEASEQQQHLQHQLDAQQRLWEQQQQLYSTTRPSVVEAAVSAAAAAATAARTAAAASSKLQMIALADSAGPSGAQEALAAAQAQLSELQRQLAEGEAVRRGLDAELARLRRQLSEEQAERAALEEQLAEHVEESEDFMAQDAVAAFEAKYNRLKTRYRELTEAHREEVDGLHDEIAGLQERLVDLEAAAAQLAVARSQAQHGEVTLAETLAKSSKASTELAALRTENQALMQELVHTKLGLAQCSEREVVGRRELYKAKETNMKLASKMTRLEVQMYKK